MRTGIWLSSLPPLTIGVCLFRLSEADDTCYVDSLSSCEEWYGANNASFNCDEQCSYEGYVKNGFCGDYTTEADSGNQPVALSGGPNDWGYTQPLPNGEYPDLDCGTTYTRTCSGADYLYDTDEEGTQPATDILCITAIHRMRAYPVKAYGYDSVRRPILYRAPG